MTIAAQDHAATGRARRAQKPTITVAEYLGEQIRLCGKTQAEIAAEAGFNKPNIISMLKHGQTKLPTNKVAAMASALNVDPLYLYRLTMSEYEPAAWAIMESQVLNQPLLSQNELEIIDIIRTAKVMNPKVRTREDEMRLIDAINTLKPENAVAD